MASLASIASVSRNARSAGGILLALVLALLSIVATLPRPMLLAVAGAIEVEGDDARDGEEDGGKEQGKGKTQALAGPARRAGAPSSRRASVRAAFASSSARGHGRPARPARAASPRAPSLLRC